MAYQRAHYWYTYDKTSNEIIFTNTNTACFWHFTEKETVGGKPLCPYNKDLNINILWDIKEELFSTLRNCIAFSKELNKIGIPITCSIKKQNYKYWNYEENERNHSEIDDIKWSMVFTIDMEKCKTFSCTVLALHFSRYMWDQNGPAFLNDMYKYKEKYNCTTWQAFCVTSKNSRNKPSHCYIQNYHRISIITQKKLKTPIKQLKKKDLKGNKMQFLVDTFVDKGNGWGGNREEDEKLIDVSPYKYKKLTAHYGR